MSPPVVTFPVREGCLSRGTPSTKGQPGANRPGTMVWGSAATSSARAQQIWDEAAKGDGEVAKPGRCKPGAPVPVSDLGWPSINRQLSRRGRARIWEWLRSWQCAFPRRPTKASPRRGCGGSSPRYEPWKTSTLSRPLSVPSTGVLREEAPSQVHRSTRPPPQDAAASMAAG